MKTPLAVLTALLFASAAWAARPLPVDLQLGTLLGSNGEMVSFAARSPSLLGRIVGLVVPGSVSYPLGPALRVYDTDNRLVLTGQLNNFAGSPVGVTFDFQGNLNRIWVLTGDELATFTH
jgi:hypothetical protein